VKNSPIVGFEWHDDRDDFEVKYKSDGFLGIGNYNNRLSDTINLGNDFDYSVLNAAGFTTATITLDTDIRETVDSFVDVEILNSDSGQIGAIKSADPDGAGVVNSWKEHYIGLSNGFTWNIPLNKISDGKFIVRYSAHGAGDNKYLVGTARVNVLIH
jgi:hypothetical protein